ncbi:response regulator [Anaerobacillus sp. HL2]|nr:response regulator [Anaerobacillus sp. HL2]
MMQDFVKEMVKEVDTEIIILHVSTLQDAISKLENEFFDAVLLDLNLPDSIGDLTFHKMKEFTTSIPIILLTGLNDESLAVNAVKKGAQDYHKRQVTSGLLLRSLNYSIERNRLMKQLQSASLIDGINWPLQSTWIF